MAKKKDLTAAAQAATMRSFSANEDQKEKATNTAQAAQESRQDERSDELSTVETKAVRGRKKTVSEPVKVFSFRASVRDVDQWRLYAAIKGDKMDDVGAAAMREYIKRHPLAGEEKALFDKRVENMKS